PPARPGREPSGGVEDEAADEEPDREGDEHGVDRVPLEMGPASHATSFARRPVGSNPRYRDRDHRVNRANRLPRWGRLAPRPERHLESLGLWRGQSPSASGG